MEERDREADIAVLSRQKCVKRLPGLLLNVKLVVKFHLLLDNFVHLNCSKAVVDRI